MAELKYEQIKEYLKAEALKPEAISSMPSVRTLMRRFNVAMATVNQALVELEHEKVIVRRQGRGIVAARGGGCLEQLPEEKEKPQILLVSPDYPAETIWRMTYMTEQYAVQKGFGVLQSRICEGACYAAFCDLAKRTPNCAALLIISPAERFSFETLETFGRLKLPVVLIDHLFLYDELPDNVYCMQHDPAVAGERMASCLLERGHTEIGYVRNEPQSDYDMQKQNAFVRTLKKAGVSMSSRIFSETIRCWENSLEAAQRIVGRNLERIRESGITALGFSSSPGAFAAIQVLRNAGFEVPGDIGVIGEGDSMWFAYGSPALTVLSPDYSELCCRAVEIAAGQFREERFFSCSQKLIERDSISIINHKSEKREMK